MMATFLCDNCGRSFEADELHRRGSICFGCHVKTIRLGFSHGQDNFHGRTIREQEREIWDAAKRDGRDIEYVGNKIG